MSAASLTKQLLLVDFVNDEQGFIDCLSSLLSEFLITRNPIFPRQDVIERLLETMTVSTSVTLIKLVIATLTEFCNNSTTYDSNFIKRYLIKLKMVKIVCCVLSGTHLYKDKMLSECCLSLLRRLSDVLLPSELQITLSDILPLCVSLCNMKRQLLFLYSARFKQMIQEMLIGKGLVMHVYKYEMSASSKKCDLMLDLFGCKQLQLVHCVGEVYDTNSSVDKNVREELVGEGLVWCSPEYEECSQSEDASASATSAPVDAWRDIVPSELVYGPHFFAHELNKLDQISDIEQVLQDETHVKLRSSPMSGDLVTVRGPLTSPHCKIEATEIYYRAQVCKKSEDVDLYRVISLDYGLLKDVPLSQMYHPRQTLIHIMPSVTLCTLRGIQPSPFSLELLDNALSILQTLTLGNFTISESMVDQWSAVKILSDLALASPNQSACKKVMIIFLHMSHCSRVRTNGMVRDKGVALTLKLIKRFASLSWREALISACQALSAMVLDNPSAGSQFEPGMGSLMNILSVSSQDLAVRKAVLYVLRNYLGVVDLSQHSRAVDSLEVVSNGVSKSKKSTTAVALPVTESLPPESLSPKGSPSSTQSSETSRKLRQSLSASQQNEPVRARITRAGSRQRQLDLNDLAIQNENMAPEEVSSTVLTRKEFYILGEQTELSTSEDCSVFQSDNSMNSTSVQKLLVGFLNAGRDGHIIYGVEAEGQAVGVHLDRERRDQLRLGLDRICGELQPSLTYSMPTVYFIPVCFADNANDEAVRCFIPDRYVVEISIDANLNQPGYRLKSDDRIFLRVGTQTTECCTQAFRQAIIAKMEKEFA